MPTFRNEAHMNNGNSTSFPYNYPHAAPSSRVRSQKLASLITKFETLDLKGKGFSQPEMQPVSLQLPRRIEHVQKETKRLTHGIRDMELELEMDMRDVSRDELEKFAEELDGIEKSGSGREDRHLAQASMETMPGGQRLYGGMERNEERLLDKNFESDSRTVRKRVVEKQDRPSLPADLFLPHPFSKNTSTTSNKNSSVRAVGLVRKESKILDRIKMFDGPIEFPKGNIPVSPRRGPPNPPMITPPKRVISAERRPALYTPSSVRNSYVQGRIGSSTKIPTRSGNKRDLMWTPASKDSRSRKKELYNQQYQSQGRTREQAQSSTITASTPLRAHPQPPVAEQSHSQRQPVQARRNESVDWYHRGQYLKTPTPAGRRLADNLSSTAAADPSLKTGPQTPVTEHSLSEHQSVQASPNEIPSPDNSYRREQELYLKTPTPAGRLLDGSLSFELPKSPRSFGRLARGERARRMAKSRMEIREMLGKAIEARVNSIKNVEPGVLEALKDGAAVHKEVPLPSTRSVSPLATGQVESTQDESSVVDEDMTVAPLRIKSMSKAKTTIECCADGSTASTRIHQVDPGKRGKVLRSRSSLSGIGFDSDGRRISKIADKISLFEKAFGSPEKRRSTMPARKKEFSTSLVMKDAMFLTPEVIPGKTNGGRVLSRTDRQISRREAVTPYFAVDQSLNTNKNPNAITNVSHQTTTKSAKPVRDITPILNLTARIVARRASSQLSKHSKPSDSKEGRITTTAQDLSLYQNQKPSRSLTPVSPTSIITASLSATESHAFVPTAFNASTTRTEGFVSQSNAPDISRTFEKRFFRGPPLEPECIQSSKTSDLILKEPFSEETLHLKQSSSRLNKTSARLPSQNIDKISDQEQRMKESVASGSSQLAVKLEERNACPMSSKPPTLTEDTQTVTNGKESKTASEPLSTATSLCAGEKARTNVSVDTANTAKSQDGTSSRSRDQEKNAMPGQDASTRSPAKPPAQDSKIRGIWEEFEMRDKPKRRFGNPLPLMLFQKVGETRGEWTKRMKEHVEATQKHESNKEVAAPQPTSTGSRRLSFGNSDMPDSLLPSRGLTRSRSSVNLNDSGLNSVNLLDLKLFGSTAQRTPLPYSAPADSPSLSDTMYPVNMASNSAVTSHVSEEEINRELPSQRRCQVDDNGAEEAIQSSAMTINQVGVGATQNSSAGIVSDNIDKEPERSAELEQHLHEADEIKAQEEANTEGGNNNTGVESKDEVVESGYYYNASGNGQHNEPSSGNTQELVDISGDPFEFANDLAGELAVVETSNGARLVRKSVTPNPNSRPGLNRAVSSWEVSTSSTTNAGSSQIGKSTPAQSEHGSISLEELLDMDRLSMNTPQQMEQIMRSNGTSSAGTSMRSSAAMGLGISRKSTASSSEQRSFSSSDFLVGDRYALSLSEQAFGGLNYMRSNASTPSTANMRGRRNAGKGTAGGVENRGSKAGDDDDEDECTIDEDDVVLKGKRIRSDQLLEPKPLRARDMDKLAELCNRSLSGLRIDEYNDSSGTTNQTDDSGRIMDRDSSGESSDWLGPNMGDPSKREAEKKRL